MKAVLITEYYDDENACSSLCRYSFLPDNIKQRVDEALLSENKSSTSKFKYSEENNEDTSRLQHLYHITFFDNGSEERECEIYPKTHFFILPGETIEYMGGVDFYGPY